MSHLEIEKYLNQILLGITLVAILLLTLYPYRWEANPFVWLHPKEIKNYFFVFQGLNFGGYSRCCAYLTYVEPAANFILFLPFGFFLSAVMAKTWVPPLKCIFLVLVISSILSFSIEFLQVFLPDRSPTLADLLMNSIGGLLGSVGYIYFGRNLLKRVLAFLGLVSK